MYNLGTIIGKRIAAIKGMKNRKNQKRIMADYILFDDGETIIQLNEQDYYCYHDCSCAARELFVHVDKRLWERIMTSEAYGDSNMDASIFS